MPTRTLDIDGPWLLQQHRRLTTRHAARLGRGVAEDLASEAVVRCLRHPAPDGDNGPWLERIFRNLLADHLRRCARQGRHASAQLLPLPLPGPEEQLLRAELHAVLARAWSRIDDDQREALLARFTDQGAELARDKLLPLPTIRTRVHRGLASLRRALGRLAALMPVFPFSLPPALQPMAATLAPVALAVLVLAQAPSAPLSTGFAQVARPAPAVPTHPLPRTCQGPSGTTPPAPSSPSAPASSQRAKPARPTPAADQTHPARPNPPGALTPRSVTRFEFEADQLVGDLQRPDGDHIAGPAARGRQPSLIEIPSSFVPAIAQSLQEIF
jgi:RNA polymerase sigma factor (sigma-70 family)